MASNKYKYPPAPPNGSGTFSDNIVGFQLVDGGGLTQANFEFSTNVVEKVNREFNTGVFSQPISLSDLNINNIEEAKRIIAKNFKVYPNFDLSQVTSFSLYGSLQKRISTSVTKIINYFPAALEVRKEDVNLNTGFTAYDIVYDNVEDITTFKSNVIRFFNPFDIDFSIGSDRNIEVRPMEVSPLRNLTRNFLSYSLFFNDLQTEYAFVDFDASTSLLSGNIEVTVQGNPFSGLTASTKTLFLKPSNNVTERVFKEDFDEVEDFLLNRMVSPKYTANFTVIKEDNSGKLYYSKRKVTWPLEGLWNLDIRSKNFNNYLFDLNSITEDLDNYKTDLISRFLTTSAFKDFDTPDRNMESVLQLYGRSFDETKKFIDALAHINSVHYNVGDDIPSQLLVNLAQTLGWNTNISPITNDGFLDSVFGTSKKSQYSGENRQKTPSELNYQYYRNLILNSAYLFKSKGTRRSIEAMMRLIGAPKALIEFNETVYSVDGPINMDRFNGEFLQITGGTKIEETPQLNPNITFSILGVTYTGFTTYSTLLNVDTNREDYPLDDNGYPQPVVQTNNMFFQKGAGWYEQTPEHRSLTELNLTDSVFTGTNSDIQTQLEPFTYGQKYLDGFRNFPYLNMGFGLTRTFDNKKSWTNRDLGLRRGIGAGFDAYYYTDNEKLILNTKNVDLGLNMGQGMIYDIWDMSRKYNYPFPSTGLTQPYPYPQGIDWTIINPKPKEKTFFEFAQTFYKNLINVRNRMFIDDGHGGGYPTLQSIYWKYLKSEEAIGIPSNKYTYQKMIDFTLGIGDYWMKLVEQMIPATTIWMGGQKMQNNVLQRQKVVWRRQRGCELIPIPCVPCEYTGNLFKYDCIKSIVTCDVEMTNGQQIFNQQFAQNLQGMGYSFSDCNTATLVTFWYVDLVIDGVRYVHYKFHEGYGVSDVPSNSDWLTGINDAFANIYQYGLNYSLNDNTLTLTSIGCNDSFSGLDIQVNVSLNFDIYCE